MALTPEMIAIGALSLILIVTLIWIARLSIRIKRLASGKDGKTLEGTIDFMKEEQIRQSAWRKEIEHYLGGVERRLGKMLHESKTVRFNAFKGTGEGGNQSFATAFLSEEGNGVVISSVFTRDRVSVYAKPIEKRESSYELSEEERDALLSAASSIEKTKNSTK